MARRKKKFFKIFFIVLLAALLVFGAVVYFTFDRVVIIQDQSFSVNMPFMEYFDFGLDLLKNGKLIWVKTLNENVLFSPYVLETEITAENKSAMVFFSPVVTSYIEDYEINVKTLLPDTITVGVGISNDKLFFDAVLVSDIDSGWAEAIVTSKYIEVHDLSDLDYADVDDKFILDYRLRNVVSKEKRLGVICPNLVRSLSPVLNFNKSEFLDGMTGYLFYEFRTEGKLF